MSRTPVTVLGATGVVGQRIVRRLEGHPHFELVGVGASERSQGKRYGDAVPWLEEALPHAAGALTVGACTPDAMAAPIVFSALDAATAARVEPEFAAAGCLVITNASTHRLDDDVPLIIPEINADHLELIAEQRARRGWSGGIIANPNCATTIVALAIAPLVRFGIRRVAVTTLQAASGAGHPGVASLDLLGNVIPWIAGEEEKLREEPRKIFGTLDGNVITASTIRFSPQVTRVPVLHGHLASIVVEFTSEVEEGRAAEAYRGWEEAVVLVGGADRPQPRRDVDRGGGMTVSVGQLRSDGVFGLRLVALGHNLERGAAGATVAIAERCRHRLETPTPLPYFTPSSPPMKCSSRHTGARRPEHSSR